MIIHSAKETTQEKKNIENEGWRRQGKRVGKNLKKQG